MRNIFLYGSFVLFILFASACNSLKNLPEGKYFLTKNVVHTDSVKLTKEEISSVLKQKPNRKILGILRLHLGLYNFGNLGDTTVEGHKFLNKFWKKTKRGMRQIGEEPVLIDSVLMEKSRRQLLILVQRKGYFNAVVTDTLKKSDNKKKASVVFKINGGQPYKIRNITYSSQDPDISAILEAAKPNSLIKTGKNYEEDVLDKERDRVTAEIRDRGMYFFNRNYITFENDSMLGTHQVDINLYANRQFENVEASSTFKNEPENHHRYHLNKIYILTNYESGQADSLARNDTTLYNGYYFITPSGLPRTEEEGIKDYIKKGALQRVLFIKSGDQFYQSDVDYTFSRLFDLNMFRFINFRFKEVPRDSFQTNYLLDVYIQLTPLAKYGYKAELEGTNNGGNLGVAGSLSFQNKNLLRVAGTLEFKVSGGLEKLPNFADNTNRFLYFFNTYNIGPELSIGFKKFLLPSFIERKTSRYFNPKSIITAGFNYQTRPDFTRLTTRLAFGWQWRVGISQRFSVYPLDINSVNVLLEPAFKEKLESTEDPSLIYSYQDHLIVGHRGVYELTNQTPDKIKNFFYFRTNGELAGILPLSSLNKVYSKYVRLDFDYSYHHVLDLKNTVVYRFAAGMGVTYGDNKDRLLPFDKAFFAGGANDNRAWLARTLGPGSYIDTINIENGGDIKLATNIEYRSALFKLLETAVFLDAGNVWLRKDPSGTLANSQFSSHFMSDIAVGAGLGLRFNFTFFIIRTDFAVKLRDPARQPEPWVYLHKKFVIGDVVPNLAIGYPF